MKQISVGKALGTTRLPNVPSASKSLVPLVDVEDLPETTFFRYVLPGTNSQNNLVFGQISIADPVKSWIMIHHAEADSRQF